MDRDLVEHIEQRVSAVREETGNAERWLQLGLLYEAHEVYGPALECYERAVELDPDQPRAWYHLALMQSETGDPASGIVSLERVSELEASYVPALWRRGFLLLESGRLDEAESTLLEARRIAPRDAAARSGLARVALQRGDAEEAVCGSWKHSLRMGSVSPTSTISWEAPIASSRSGTGPNSS